MRQSIRRRTAAATALKIELARQPDRRYQDGKIYLVGSAAWNGRDHANAHRLRHSHPELCPVCRGNPLPEGYYCAYCDRSGLDGLVVFNGLPIGYAMDPTYAGSGTSYKPSGNLAGGQGSKAKPGKVKGKQASKTKRRREHARRH